MTSKKAPEMPWGIEHDCHSGSAYGFWVNGTAIGCCRGKDYFRIPEAEAIEIVKDRERLTKLEDRCTLLCSRLNRFEEAARMLTTPVDATSDVQRAVILQAYDLLRALLAEKEGKE